MADHWNLNASTQQYRSARGVRGFIGFIAVALWFLCTVLGTGAANAASPETLKQGSTIYARDIIPDIEAALMAKGMAAHAKIHLALPEQSVPLGAAIANTSYNPLTGRFVIRLAGDSAPIVGETRVTRTVPVLTRDLARGEIIRQSDFTVVESSTVNDAIHVINPDELTGMEARRALTAGSPLRRIDIAAPVLIRKGALVTVSYAIDGLKLTHQAIALDKGAKGDVISIRNTQSERVLKGVIAGENFVSILAPSTINQGTAG